MLKIIKRTIPLETEGTINRLSAELAEARGETEVYPFQVDKLYEKDDYLVYNGRVFIVKFTIVSGELAIPGYNIDETSMEEVINALQKEV